MGSDAREETSDSGAAGLRGRLRLWAGAGGVVVAMLIGFGATYSIVGDRRDVVWQRIDNIQNGVSRWVDLPWHEEPPPPERATSWIQMLAERVMQHNAERWAKSAEQYETVEAVDPASGLDAEGSPTAVGLPAPGDGPVSPE